MVDLAIEDGKLKIHVKGADQLWAFRSTLEIPLAHIAGVRTDPSIADGWWKGLKLMGTNLPGVISAGTFYQHGKTVFWDVHHGEKAIILDLHDERYDELIVEVEDPSVAIRLIQGAAPHTNGC
jgi:hypothetical protein